MSALDLLQQLGLTKYEAEAYRALLAAGPLTGYELGKHSSVPVSRCYDTLERLLARGLAVVQPSAPPRYAAEDPARFLARARAEREATVAALADALADLARPGDDEQFWVLRGQRAILDRAVALIAGAGESVLIAHSGAAPELLAASDEARGRGVRIVERGARATEEGPAPDALQLLVDDQTALVGMLAPAEWCQATVSGNPALVAAVRANFTPETRQQPTLRILPDISPDTQGQRLAWLAWDEQKQRRLISGQ